MLLDFKCDNCGHEWEEFAPKEGRHLICLACTSTKVRRVMRPPRINRNRSDYDLLDRRPPDPPVFSGRYTRSKG
jgi:hypothetical protein